MNKNSKNKRNQTESFHTDQSTKKKNKILTQLTAMKTRQTL